MAVGKLMMNEQNRVESRKGMPVSEHEIALLELIANKKDRAAFVELHALYERPAYNLARFMTRNPDMAEETVQEAMLVVWKSAGTFVPGDPRAWVLRIVANKSMALAKRNTQKEKRVKSIANLDERESTPAKEDHQEEELALLRSGMSDLTSKERNVLGLYFGVGLSQREIAKNMSIPQTTVSFRIQNALKRLRVHMGAASLSAALPAVFEQEVRNAICLSFEPPAGLTAKVLEKVECLDAGIGRPDLAPKSPVWQMVWLGAGILLVAGLAGLLYLQNGKNENQADPVATVQPKAVRGIQLGNLAKGLSHLSWEFGDGIPDNLKILNGIWKPGVVNGKKGIIVSKDIPLLLRLPFVHSQRPFTIKLFLVPMKERLSIEGHWSTGNTFLGYETCSKHYVLNEGQDVIGKLMFVNEYIVSHDFDKLTGFKKYERAYPGTSPSIVIKGYFLSRIELQEFDAPQVDPLQAEIATRGVKEFKRKSMQGITFPQPGPGLKKGSSE